MSLLPSYRNINNGVLSFTMAMPQKDIPSVNESRFAMDRHEYIERFPNPSVNIQNANKKWILGTATVFTKSATDPTNIGKKWIPNSNRDASSIAEKKRVRSVGLGTMSAGSHSFGNHNSNINRQTVQDARIRCRAGGSVVPAKCQPFKPLQI